MPSIAHQLEQDGFARLPDALGGPEIAEIENALAGIQAARGQSRRAGGANYAMRRLLNEPAIVAALRQVAPLASAIKEILGAPIAVRGIFFDKPFRANWSVPWHQDLTIAVRAKHITPGYQSWTTKGGVTHVRPPMKIMQQMITARIHLDSADAGNGALRVARGSHTRGHIPASDVPAMLHAGDVVRCDMRAGEIMLMRPLLLHSSNSTSVARSRRVVHIEFCAASLTPPLEWQHNVSLGPDAQATVNE